MGAFNHHQGRHRIRAAVAAGAIVMLAATACAGAGADDGSDAAAVGDSMATMEPIVLTYTDILPQNGPAGLSFRAFADEVEERSGGKITFEEYYSATLMPGDETLSGVASGVADMGLVFTSYYPSELPIANWLNGFAGTYSTEFPTGMLQNAGTLHNMALGTDELVQEFEDLNLRVLWAEDQIGRFTLQCAEPVTTLAEAQGMRVRVGGQVWAREAEALGMVPVSMPISEMYEGIQRGVVDCIINYPPTAIDLGLWEVAPHYMPARFSGMNGNRMTINLDVWNELPLDAQQLVYDAGLEMWKAYLEHNLAAFERYATEGVEAHGVTFHDTSELDAVLSEHQAAEWEQLAATAPEGVADPQTIVDAYQASLDEWLALVNGSGTIPDAFETTDAMEAYLAIGELDLDAFAELGRTHAFDPYRP